MDRLRSVLATAAKERSQRQGTVTTEDGSELAWVLYEREAMHAEVNRLRAQHSLAAVDATEIRRAESMACGHVDYAKKFALYCAELTSPAVQAERARRTSITGVT